MKKSILFSMLLMAAPVTLFAQLKVHSTGQVGIIATGTPSNNAKLTVGSTNNIATNENINLHSCIQTGISSTNIGVNGVVLNGTGSGSSIGVRGYAHGGGYGLCFGVLGNLNNYDYGAGIFGGVNCPQGIAVSGKYAGYFYGATYVNGSLTAQNIYNLSDMRLKDDVISLSETMNGQGGVLDKLTGLDVISYKLKNPSLLMENQIEHELTEQEKQDAERRHYGVSAQELQNIFPDLVCEGQDGYLIVSYTEMVPILLRCIQELKQELDEMKGAGADDKSLSRNTATGITSTASSGNMLYQNTPNPFKEKTVIRFKLADDAQNAAICIFDLTGKQLKKLPISSGETSVSVNGWELGEGMFLYTLLVNGQEIDTKRMVITK